MHFIVIENGVLIPKSIMWSIMSVSAKSRSYEYCNGH